jgi:hypothetical protein
MAEKLRSDKYQGFGRNLTWFNSNRFIGINVGTEANNKKLKPGCAGVPGEKRTRWYIANTSVDHNRQTNLFLLYSEATVIED